MGNSPDCTPSVVRCHFHPQSLNALQAPHNPNTFPSHFGAGSSLAAVEAAYGIKWSVG